MTLNRTLSGANLDDDVRAGPWPATATGNDDEVSVHIYVDHAIVSLIAGNDTALSAWVAPQRAESIGVGLFGDMSAGEVARSVVVFD